MSANNNGRRQIVVVEAPAHPVSQLQGPFEESMFESQSSAAEENDVPLDASTRRNMLLEAPTYQRVIAGRWKQKPGEKFHPLWKLVAQMSFGIHLLSEGMAVSEEDVFLILQNHVDDIDIFLERTTEDFTLAQDDIQERLKCLKLPLQHPEVFERMLEDRTFRNSIVEGNEKIEHIVNRTGSAMKDALKDVQKGFDSSSALEKYLSGLETTWVRKSAEHEAVYVAMMGNVEGWKRAFLELHVQGNKLAGSLRKLTEVVNQMQQKAGEVSRRLVRQQHRQGGSITNSNSFTYHSRQHSPNRSSSRQHHSSSNSKRILPSPSPGPGRHHSRNNSKEGPRAESSQTQRSGTGLSMRSTSDARTETPTSRSVSRTDTPSSGPDPTKMNLGSPRIVYVKSHTGHHRANSVSASVRGAIGSGTESRNESALSNRSGTPQHQLKKQDSTISTLDQPTPRVIEPKQFAPVELPAEIPPEAFLSAPLSNRNRLSGIGLLPSERRAQAATDSKAFNPATALVELLRDPSRYSKLPLTPKSATSPSIPAGALSALEGKKHLTVDAQAVRREPTPEQTPPVGNENMSDGTPTTPAWASQVVNDAERQRVLAEKIPFATRTPQIGADDEAHATPKPESSKPNQPKLDTAIEGSVDSNLGQENTSATAPSELSAGYEDNLPQLTRQQAEAAMMIDTPEISTKSRKKLSFIAELEGSEPVFLPSTVYTPLSAVAQVPEAHELDGSDSYFSLPIQSNNDEPASAVISELSSDRNSRLVRLDDKSLARSDSDQIEIVLEEAIRKSVSDVEVPTIEPPPIPDSVLSPQVAELPTQMTPRPQQFEDRKAVSVGTSVEAKPALSPIAQAPTSPLETKAKDEKAMENIKPTLESVTEEPTAAETTRSSESVDISKAGLDQEGATKSRPVTTIHSPLDIEQVTIQAVSPGFVTAKSSPHITTLLEDSGKEKARPSSGFQRSVSETKVTLGKKRLSVFPPLRSPSTTVIRNKAPASPASAPDTATRASPKSSFSANSPASLMSVHSAPAADLTRSTTKETRKQWKAFFSGQLKSPATSVKSLKSPSASITSSHKHTNSQASQTNASIKTLWLSSPVLGDSPTNETVTLPETRPSKAESEVAKEIEPKRPSVVDVRQPSSPTLGRSQPTIGLGLISSPTVETPMSGVDTPVIATATTSTAYTRIAPRKVSTGLSTQSVPATTSTFISHPKPRMIEVRRKAVGSGINSGSGSRPSSAAENHKRESTTDDRATISVTPEPRSISPMPKVNSPTAVSVDEDATPKIGSTIDTKPKLTIETNTPRQIHVVKMSKPSPAKKEIKDIEKPPTSSTSPQTKVEDKKVENEVLVQPSAPPTEPKIVALNQEQQEKERDPSQLEVINESDPISNHDEKDSMGFTKGHERDSSDDNYDFLDAYA